MYPRSLGDKNNETKNFWTNTVVRGAVDGRDSFCPSLFRTDNSNSMRTRRGTQNERAGGRKSERRPSRHGVVRSLTWERLN